MIKRPTFKDAEARRGADRPRVLPKFFLTLQVEVEVEGERQMIIDIERQIQPEDVSPEVQRIVRWVSW